MADNHSGQALVTIRRGWLRFAIMALLICATLLGLAVSWAQPDQSLWIFWLMTQVLPVFYLILSVLTAVLTPAQDPE